MAQAPPSASRFLFRLAILSLPVLWTVFSLQPVPAVLSEEKARSLPVDRGIRPPPTPVDWTTGTSKWQGQWGRRETLLCPAGGRLQSVWGTDVYTDDSSVCTAAVHAGLISAAAGGPVTIEVRPDQSRYVSSTRNGVTTQDWLDVWPSSFLFIWGPALSEPEPAVQATGRMSADSWPGQVGRVMTFLCPPRFELHSVYGTDTYADDSYICSAGVHAGVITQAAGGMVTIKLLPGQSSYAGSTRHGLTSFSIWSGRPQSFMFVATPSGTPPPPAADSPFLAPPGSPPGAAGGGRRVPSIF